MSTATPTDTMTDDRVSMLEMDGAPAPRPTPVNHRLVKALHEINTAPDLASLERAIVPLRAWPEGPDKVAARTALRAREAHLKANGPLTPMMWEGIGRTLWRALANAIGADSALHNRPYLRPRPAPAPAPEPTLNQVIAEELARDTTPASTPTTDLIADLQASVAESQGNASVQGIGSMAGGQMRGVGFSSDQGYITALANGVKRATADRYIALLKSHGVDTSALVVTIIPEGPAEGTAAPSTGPIVHTPTGPSYFDQGLHKQRKAPGAPVQTAQETRIAVSRQDVIIGAQAEGSGVLTGWAGLGEMTRSGILEVLTEAGLPTAWAPAPKSDHFHASAALTAQTHSGRVLRVERGRNRQMVNGQYRTYVARWTMGDPTHGQVGDKFGLTVMTASLTGSGQLDLSGEPEACEKVRSEYERRRGEGGVFPAGEVTDWLRQVLVYQFGAVRMGANWYVPHRVAPVAEGLLNRIALRWGNAWILPALPVATTDQLRAGLVRGLCSEADQVLTELEAQREQARADKRADIGAKSAATLLGRLRDVYTRAMLYATMMEPRFTALVREKLEAALAIVEPLCDDTAQRFAMLDLA